MADDCAEFINANLQFLKKKTRRLHETVDELVNEVSSACQSWLNGGDGNQMSFAEINTRLYQCITYVNQKADQIAKETSGDKGLTLVMNETATETKRLSSSTSQVSASTRHSLPVVQGQEPDESRRETRQIEQKLQSFEGSQLYCPTGLLARLHTVELALSSVHSVTEKISENQSKVETQIQEIKQKQSEMEEVTTKHLADTEKQLKKANKHSEGMKQQEKRVACLEKDMDMVKKQEKRVSSLETQIQDVKKQDKKFDCFEKEMKTMSCNHSELEKKMFVKIASVEKQIETNIDLTYHLKAGIESVSNKTEANESSIQKLTSRVHLSDTTVHDLSVKVDENKSLIDEANLKTRNLNKKINKYQKNTSEKLQEVERGYHMVCCMVADRLLPLERLRRILNQKVKDREDNVKKLGDVCTTVASLQNKVSDLESKQLTKTGFSAHFTRRLTEVTGAVRVLEGFTDIRCNMGNHFNPSTGIFTAPLAGIYVAYVSLSYKTFHRFAFNHKLAKPRYQTDQLGQVVKADQIKGTEPRSNASLLNRIYEIDTDLHQQDGTSFRIIEMSPGDQLCVTVTRSGLGLSLFPDGETSFSCFLVG